MSPKCQELCQVPGENGKQSRPFLCPHGSNFLGGRWSGAQPAVIQGVSAARGEHTGAVGAVSRGTGPGFPVWESLSPA